MNTSKLEECHHCLGSGEEIHNSILGTKRAKTCSICQGLGEVESVVNDYYLSDITEF